MALIERFTPGGNMYPDGGSTFATLVQAFRRIAETRDGVDTRMTSAWQQAINAVAAAREAGDAQQETAWKAADALLRSDWQTGDTNTLSAAVTAAATHAITTAGQARTNAVADAKAYTDGQVAAVQAGAVPDSRIDAGVDRAVSDGRISTTVGDTALAAALQTAGSASGAAVAALVDKRSAVVNALDYGYDPTGVNTSNVQLQAAMDSLVAFGGGTVFVPDGELKIAVSLKPRDKVRVICNEGRVRVTATSNTYAFLVDQPTHQAIPNWFTVEGFVFEGAKRDLGVYPNRDENAPAVTGLKSGGWFMGLEGEKPDMPYVGDITYRNCTFKNMFQPIHYAGISGHGKVTGCTFINTYDPSFTYMSAARSLTYTDNVTLNGGDNGVSVSRLCKNAVISDNVFLSCAFNGVWVSGFASAGEVPGYGPERFAVTGNVVYNCGEGGIALIDAPRYGTVSGNLVDTILRGPVDTPTFNRGYGIRITGFAPDGVTITRYADTLNISGNIFRNIPRAGVSIQQARNVRIGENMFVNVGEQYVMDAGGTVTTTPIPSTDTQYNCGIMSPHSASLTNVIVVNNTFIDERPTPFMNYGIAPNLAGVIIADRNIVIGSRNPHNEPVTAGNKDSTDAAFVVNGRAGSYRSVRFQTAGSNRWMIRATGSTETGTNTGTNLDFIRYSDTGATLGTPLSIDRATGVARFNEGSAIFGGGLTLANGSTLTIGTGTGSSIGVAASKLAFYGATPVARPVLTYPRAAETAPEAQLRGVLVALGLATDNTTA